VIRKIGLYFPQFNTLNNPRQLLSQQQFDDGLAKLGINLTTEEFQGLVKLLDVDGNGQVDFQEFLTGIRGKLSSRRQGSYFL
jgi:Ca2+-binding EF-hand superfamily protein